MGKVGKAIGKATEFVSGGRAQRKALEKERKGARKAADREAGRIAAGEAQIDRSFADDRIAGIVDPRAAQVEQSGIGAANAQFEQARGATEINLANRGMLGQRNRAMADRRLRTSLAVTRAGVAARAQALRDSLRASLLAQADELKLALRQGAQVPGDLERQQKARLSAAIAAVPYNAVGNALGVGADTITANARAGG